MPPEMEAAMFETAMSLAERVRNATTHCKTVQTSFGTVLAAQAQEDAVQAVWRRPCVFIRAETRKRKW